MLAVVGIQRRRERTEEIRGGERKKLEGRAQWGGGKKRGDEENARRV